MGNPSYVEHEDLRFIDKTAKSALKKAYEIGCKNCIIKTECVTEDKHFKELNCHKELLEQYFEWDKNGNEFKLLFEERKIIQYWYKDTLEFLDFIANYIEGTIELSYSGDHEKAEIIFVDKTCKIKLGKPTWEWETFTTKNI